MESDSTLPEFPRETEDNTESLLKNDSEQGKNS